MKKFDVHLFAVVRVKIRDVKAADHKSAAEKAERLASLNHLFARGRTIPSHVSDIEFADEVKEYLVEPVANAQSEGAIAKCFEPSGDDGLTEVPFESVSIHVAVVVEGGIVTNVIANRPVQFAVLDHDNAEDPDYCAEQETEFQESDVDPMLHCTEEFKTRHS